jgi:tetraacyldisaccharide 4'-kinase
VTPPHFWQVEDGREAAPLTRALLTPLGWLYAAVTAAKIARATPVDPGAPVVCVGNLTVGGAGKTPIVRAVRERFAAAGVPAAVLSRGHGGRLKGPVRVDPSIHGAGDVGDEPLLHAGDGPAYIARDRAAGARAAVADGARAIVMDDGHQNPSLAKALSLVVVDAQAGWGNGRIVPAGPLREPVAAGLARADAVILMRGGPQEVGAGRPDLPTQAPVLEAWLEPVSAPPPGAWVAFCGIGRPAKFEATLRELGLEPIHFAVFPDHHPYSDADMERLRRLASADNARLLTTDKDKVRVPARFRPVVETVKVAARFADPAALDALLAPVIGAAR